MKKIITLVFFVGFLTSAFAQSGGRKHNANQNTYSKTQSPANSQWSNQDHQSGYAFNKDRNDRNRDYRGGNDEFRSRNFHEGKHNYGRSDNYRDNRKGSWFRFMFSKRDRH